MDNQQDSQEAKKIFDALHDKGWSDQDILKACAVSFQDGRMNRKDLIAVAMYLKADINPDFVNAETDEEAKALLFTKPEHGYVKAEDLDPDLKTMNGFREAIDQLLKEKRTPDEIMQGLAVAFREDELTKDQFIRLAKELGFEMDPEFVAEKDLTAAKKMIFPDYQTK